MTNNTGFRIALRLYGMTNIYIPFCLSKCGYCSFYSIKSVNLIPEYIAALKKEIKHYRNAFSSFDTIYIGGGTPSLLSFQQIDDLISTVNKYFDIDQQAEITMEINPGDVSLDYFQALRKLKIHRLNIGVQSFDDKILQPKKRLPQSKQQERPVLIISE